MKNFLIILAVLISLSSLLVSCISNDKYGVTKDNIIQKITPGNNLKPEKGITPELLKKSSLNPLETFTYSSKKINYRIVDLLDYTYDCSHKKLFTATDGIPKAIPNHIIYANDTYTNWYLIAIVVFSILSIMLCVKKVKNLLFFFMLMLVTLYSYVIEEYNMYLCSYVLVVPLVLVIVFEWMYIEVENRKLLNFISTFLIIFPIILFYWIF